MTFADVRLLRIDHSRVPMTEISHSRNHDGILLRVALSGLSQICFPWHTGDVDNPQDLA